jgi:hypothetical protein
MRKTEYVKALPKTSAKPGKVTSVFMHCSHFCIGDSVALAYVLPILQGNGHG